MQEEKRGDRKKGGLIAAFAGVIVVLLGVIVVLLVGRGKETAPVAAEPETAARGTVVTRDNAEEIAEQMSMAEYVEPGYYTVSMTNVWHFSKGNAVSGDAYVENMAGNTNDVFFDVVLASDEDVTLLASPVIPRGARWDEIALDEPLDAGTYDCVMVYHLIDEAQKTVSTLRVGLTIVVEG